MQAEANKPRIEITVDEDGVEAVRLFAPTPEAEEIALSLFQQVRPLLQQFRLLLAAGGAPEERQRLN